MFIYILLSISILHHFVYTYVLCFKNSLFLPRLSYTGDFLMEGSLIGPDIFLKFSVTLKKNSEQLCLKLPIIDIQRVMGG